MTVLSDELPDKNVIAFQKCSRNEVSDDLEDGEAEPSDPLEKTVAEV